MLSGHALLALSTSKMKKTKSKTPNWISPIFNFIKSGVRTVPYRTVTGTPKNWYGFSLPYRYGTGNGTDQYGPGMVTENRTKNRTGTVAVPSQCLHVDVYKFF